MAQDAPLRIAHGFGNSRDLVRVALESYVDVVEADLRLRGDGLWLGHDRRLPLLPVLFGRRSPGPFFPAKASLSLGPWQVRLDIHALLLEELLEMIAGRRRLLLDLKQPRRASDVPRFVDNLAGLLQRFQLAEETYVCGDWPLLDEARRQGTESAAYYSVAGRSRWQALVRRIEGGEKMDGVSLRSTLLDNQAAGFLRDNGVRVFCWPVDDRAEAARVLELGADGIISNDIALLALVRELLGDGQSERQRSGCRECARTERRQAG
jgi:glycerophosphoryl diester phosphodiesterase